MGADVLVGHSPSPPDVASGSLAAAPRRRRRFVRFAFWALIVLLAVSAAVAIGYELQTSALQAYLLPRYTAKVTYKVGDGPSPSIAFPRSAPFDDRLGYSRIGEFQQRLEERGFVVERQAVVSPELIKLLDLDIAPPYREPLVAGLTIHGMNGTRLYDAARSARAFRGFDDVPPLLVQTLLFIENRELLQPFDPRANPAIEWDRMAKASLLYAGSKLGLNISIQGGSTLAIQLEKYRHSPNGRTYSPLDKLRQVAGASLKAYREGADTRSWRRQIVVDYLNTAPLAAAPGYGEIYGIGDALYAWFGIDLKDVKARLTDPATPLDERASAYKHALALVIALRAPTYYLQRDRLALNQKVNEYTRLLEHGDVIDPEFAAAVRQAPIDFLSRAPVAPPLPFAHKKAPNAIRTTLMQWLDMPSFYELDRLHLEADGTIDLPLQSTVERLFANLGDEKFVRANGLTGEHLMRSADPSQVVYSLMLFERTPQGNLLRVNADNLDRPFDINGGVKLDLGSTAKMRTTAHYLEVVAMLRDELAGKDHDQLTALAKAKTTDPLTAWAAETLAETPDISLGALLQKSLDRKYSTNTGEVFFTGGGQHIFHNFTKDCPAILPMRDGLRTSNNLVFVRVMRDLVRYHQARLPYDANALLNDPHYPERERIVAQLADEEAQEHLSRAYARYHGLTTDAAIVRLLGSRAKNPRQLTVLFYAWKIGTTPTQLGEWLRANGAPVDNDEVQRLVRAYGGKLSLLDYGYLLGRHPLEVWTVGELVHEPGTNWPALLERSAGARGQVSQWLLRAKVGAAQRTRMRIYVERDVFARMTPYWQRLGFPFKHLVPSLATAIGSSSDRPAALADLMGIVVNDGKRLPMQRITKLHFGEGTPYETVMVPDPKAGEQVMRPEVAKAVRGVLATVVEAGTARRVAGAFKDAAGKPIVTGGKTGSGDNRFKTFARGGFLKSSRAVNRTATFTFYIGDRYFGVITAFVPGQESDQYEFTSALSVSVLRLLAPAINARIAGRPLPEQPDADALAASKPTQRTGG
ncbi:MAG TPA: transglycosylase domain-containing protein [Candidatus Dormibacteraeota bacterium]|nr:transglycosylase domain-containing protein [Candidatus Dormibacteraeota bacterium]